MTASVLKQNPKAKKCNHFIIATQTVILYRLYIYIDLPYLAVSIFLWILEKTQKTMCCQNPDEVVFKQTANLIQYQMQGK